MREPFIVGLVRGSLTSLAMGFGDAAFRLEDGLLHYIALFAWASFTIMALEMWADRINRGRR